MAGIGFQLRRILARDDYTSTAKAYLYATVLSAGPWLSPVVCLVGLGIFYYLVVSYESMTMVRITIIYTYIFSFIFTGSFQVLETRYLSDIIYQGKKEACIPAFVSIFILILPISLFMATGFYYFVDMSILYRLIAVSLYTILCGIWLGMNFLSALKDYAAIFCSFFIGALVSFLGAIGLGRVLGIEGFLLGFTIGQFITFVMFLGKILSEFSGSYRFSTDIFRHIKIYPELLVTGLAFNMAIWVDKFIFWLPETGVRIHSLFYSCGYYEGSTLLAFLTVIPSFAIFLIRVETGFYEKWRLFYATLLYRRPLALIQKSKREMIDSLRNGILDLVKIQAPISMCFLIFAPQIMGFLRLSPVALFIFRIAVIGAFLQAFLMMSLIILYYFDFRKSVMQVTLVYLVAHLFLSYVTHEAGIRYFGYGYFFANLLCLSYAYTILSKKLDNLEYITFAFQPLPTL